MQLTVIAVGKTDQRELNNLIGNYISRLGKYISFNFDIIPDVKASKSRSIEQQKISEGEEIIARLKPTDFVVLFDEHGKTYTSREFAEKIERRMNESLKRLVFVIGGPYGFSKAVYERANSLLSLSKMTFSHQMVRLFAVEQIYRAFTILNKEPYHHD